ncbi:hypothetical protein [Brucella sp. LJL56]
MLSPELAKLQWEQKWLEPLAQKQRLGLPPQPVEKSQRMPPPQELTLAPEQSQPEERKTQLIITSSLLMKG